MFPFTTSNRCLLSSLPSTGPGKIQLDCKNTSPFAELYGSEKTQLKSLLPMKSKMIHAMFQFNLSVLRGLYSFSKNDCFFLLIAVCLQLPVSHLLTQLCPVQKFLPLPCFVSGYGPNLRKNKQSVLFFWFLSFSPR